MSAQVSGSTQGVLTDRPAGPGTSAPAISVHGLRKTYGENEAVGGIDFEVASGEVFGFLGPNGAGKTTTIEILEGYRPRTAGEVSVLGTDPGTPTREWRARIGLVLQECELNPLLTVAETMKLYSSFFPNPRPVDETLRLVGLGDASAMPASARSPAGSSAGSTWASGSSATRSCSSSTSRPRASIRRRGATPGT